jgi:hypothetical protein
MSLKRRDVLKRGSLALFGSGFLSRMDKVDGMQSARAGGSLADIVKNRATGASEKMLLGPQPGKEGPPEPAKFDRLPLEWNKRTVAQFKDELAKQWRAGVPGARPAQHHLSDGCGSSKCHHGEKSSGSTGHFACGCRSTKIRRWLPLSLR